MIYVIHLQKNSQFYVNSIPQGFSRQFSTGLLRAEARGFNYQVHGDLPEAPDTSRSLRALCGKQPTGGTDLQSASRAA